MERVNRMDHRIVSDLGSGRLCLFVHAELYHLEAIRAAAYKFTSLAHILIKPLDEWEILVIFEGKEGVEDVERIAKDYANELLDQQVRIDLESRFGELRKLIVRQAFAPVTTSCQGTTDDE